METSQESGRMAYKRGAKFEYMIMALLKKHLDPDKYTVIRTAGCHSPVDIYIIEHRGTRAKDGFGIQCKSTKKKKLLRAPEGYYL